MKAYNTVRKDLTAQRGVVGVKSEIMKKTNIKTQYHTPPPPPKKENSVYINEYISCFYIIKTQPDHNFFKLQK